MQIAKSMAISLPFIGRREIATKNVRRVLGSNLFDVTDWSRYYRLSFAPEVIAAIPPFPWTLELLNSPCPFVKRKKIRQTHFAFLGLDTVRGKALTLAKFIALHPEKRWPHFDSGPTQWYLAEGFASIITCSFQWHLLLKRIVPGSKRWAYERQQGMLPPEYEPPLAITEAMKDIFHYRTHFFHRCLNDDCWARCRDRTADGKVVERSGVSTAPGFLLGNHCLILKSRIVASAHRENYQCNNSQGGNPLVGLFVSGPACQVVPQPARALLLLSILGSPTA